MAPPTLLTTYGWILLLSLVFAVMLGQYAWRRKDVPGAKPFVAMMVLGLSWIVAGMLQGVTHNLSALLVLEQVQAVAALSAVTASLCFALEYAGLQKWLTRRTLVLLMVPLVAYVLLDLTNAAHHLIRTRVAVDANGVIRLVNGPALLVLTGYGYLLILLTWTILVWLFIRSPLHRAPVGMILIAQVVTRGAYLFHATYPAPFASIDPVIPPLIIGYLMYFLALFRFNGFDLVPAAQGTTIARMSDGMLVLDDLYRVVELNPAAETLLGARPVELIGKNATEHWESLPNLVQAIRAAEVGHAEVMLEVDAAQRFLDITASPLPYAGGRRQGRLVLLRDVTAHRQSDEALKRAYDDLERQIAVRTTELRGVNEALSQENVERQRAEAELWTLNATLESRVADRTRELFALYEILAFAARLDSEDEFIEKALEITVAALRSESGAVWLRPGDAGETETGQLRIAASRGVPRTAIHELPVRGHLYETVCASRQPLVITDIAADPLVPTAMRSENPHQALLLAPLQTEGQLIGVTGVMRDAGTAFTGEEVALLSTIADQIAVTMQSHHLRQVAQQASLLAERQRVARDLHNSVTQALYGLVAFTEAGQAQMEGGDLASVGRSLVRIGETTRQALREMRLFIYQSRPDVLEQEGLVGALQLRLAAVEGRADMQVNFCADGSLKLALPLECALYKVAQEALNNILRHARATAVNINLRCEEDRVTLEVSDDGCGFDVQHPHYGGMGLESLRVITQEVGGTLEITSTPAKGTTVRATVPIKE